MGWFGSRCLRCNQPLQRETPDGVPTCERCSELIRARLQAGAEAERACPQDGQAMSKEVVHDIVVDRCPVCGGVWLDGGELGLLRQAIEDGGRSGLLRTVVLGMTRA